MARFRNLAAGGGSPPYSVHHQSQQALFAPEDVLLFGRESAGAPEAVHAAADARLLIPMRPGMRSLNVAMAAALAAGEALRQAGATSRPSGND